VNGNADQHAQLRAEVKVPDKWPISTNNDDLPTYDAFEQGVEEDFVDLPAATVERKERRARNTANRQSLLARLNDGDASLQPSLKGQWFPASVEQHILRVVIYLRVSTEEQAKIGGELEGYSIPAQRESCLGKARDMKAIVVKEYVDAGESAKSANRPELQKMLRELKRLRVDYVIIAKIDRLARNRADDVDINALIATAGAKLVSVAEPVDDSPAGKLLYNVMADVAQYHSDNLAVEVLKGMNQKAQRGGTPYRAPLGYLNHRELVDGVDIRTVVVDDERAPLIRWMLEEYATGQWTLQELADVLEVRGLRTRPTPKAPARPVVAQTLHRLLCNPYFFGVVPYRGIYYEGKHKPLISAETWLRIQDVLSEHSVAGEKTRKHPHYLKGTVWCGECGSRLVYTRHRGSTGAAYEYFACMTRKTKRGPTCSRTGTRVHLIEEGITRFYRRFQLGAARADAIREAVRHELAVEQADAHVTQERARKLLRQRTDERDKLLRAYYAGSIPDDLLGPEMERLTREMTNAKADLAAATQGLVDLDATLEAALTIAQHCTDHYDSAPPRIRRQINQGLFTKLYIGRDGDVERYELTEPFLQLLADDLGRTVGAVTTESGGMHGASDSQGASATSAVLTAPLSHVRTPKRPGSDATGPFSNKHHLVPPAGIEPATHGLGNRCSIP
jgi:site-specific DNA recombinase